MTCENIRFYEYNILGEGNITASSELANFPATYAVNTSRTKPWKPSGHFEITTSNRSVYINDGVDRQVDISVGDYDTPDDLATEIQTELNNVSSGWTITYSSTTYKFTFSRSTSATLRFSETTNAIWDDIGFTGSTNQTGSSFVADEERIHTSEYVLVDAAGAVEATFIGIIADREEIFCLPDSASVTLYANNVNDFTSPPFSETLSVSSRGAFKHMTGGDYYRYWKVEIIDRRNILGPTGLTFGFIYIGTHSTLINTNIAKGFSKEIKDSSISMTSEAGQKFTDIRSQFESFNNMAIQLADNTDRKTVEQLFTEYGVHTPFFVSFDPGLVLDSDAAEYTRYVYFGRDPTVSHAFLEYNNMSLVFTEAL